MSNIGFVYVMHNPAMNGIYKIGFTMRSPHARALELSASTGVPLGYEIVYYGEIEEPASIEAEIHESLAEFRLNESREFFRVKLAKIMSVIDGLDEWLSEFRGSEYLAELSMPGSMFGPGKPMAFESSLHEPGRLNFWSQTLDVRALGTFKSGGAA